MISVIVPIFNVENYLDECLKSIINQTYKDIEILCIDDCTLDNSINTVKKYMRMDSRIRLINHEENRGLGGARNTGIQEARGEYIAFVDSDDVLDLSMLEKCYKAITTYDVDAVVCAVRRFCDNQEIASLSTFHYMLSPKSRIYFVADHKERLIDIWPSAPNKLYKASIIKEFACHYPERVLYEDHFFYYSYFSHVRAFYYIYEPLYNYRANRSGSITSTVTGREDEVFNILEGLKPVFKDLINNEHCTQAYAKICFRLIWERQALLWQQLPDWKVFCKKAEKWLLQRFDIAMLNASIDTNIGKSDAFYRYIFSTGWNKVLFRIKLSLKGKTIIVKAHAWYNKIKSFKTKRSYIREMFWVNWENYHRIKELIWVDWDTHSKIEAINKMLESDATPKAED